MAYDSAPRLGLSEDGCVAGGGGMLLVLKVDGSCVSTGGVGVFLDDSGVWRDAALGM
jgi:hypothetical protein